jgi:superfamily II DNA or RNA helicase
VPHSPIETQDIVVLPAPPPGPVTDLMPHQYEAVDFLVGDRAALLAYDTGTGKTAAAIRAMERLKARRTLVICQAIARQMWARQCEEWQQTPHALQVIRSAEDTENLNGDVVIISFDLARSMPQSAPRRPLGSDHR